MGQHFLQTALDPGVESQRCAQIRNQAVGGFLLFEQNHYHLIVCGFVEFEQRGFRIVQTQFNSQTIFFFITQQSKTIMPYSIETGMIKSIHMKKIVV
ncbi:hypothetical protein [Stenoxybacter acetivorans]|uniref:hypothetical protein n=1 Tax=Stenoxybacter acetivorans TaxID=422441 RepID=UPI000566CBE2|nr:hypothetical protein [Stenoxybacter acetivorans]